MADFFTALEDQLRDAARERRGRLGRLRRRRVAAAGASLAALVGAGTALAAGLGGSASPVDSPARHGPRPVPATTRGAQPAALTPSAATRLRRFSVAVLNGTTTPGAAGATAMALAREGVRLSIVTNAPDHTQALTRVYFRGRHVQEAALIASLLPPSDAGLRQLRPGSPLRAIAGRDADVIVVVGADGRLRTPPRLGPPRAAGGVPKKLSRPGVEGQGGAPARIDGVSLAILDGTRAPGVAAEVRAQLRRGGGRIDAVMPYADQGVTRSQVYYRPGHAPDAARVASLLGQIAGAVPLRQLRPGDAIATMAPHAPVVVLVGSDLAAHPPLRHP